MKWIETSHTRGWWLLMVGRKEAANIRRVFPRKTKTGYRYQYMVVTRWGIVDGLPGMGGPVFNTLTEAKARAERGVK